MDGWRVRTDEQKKNSPLVSCLLSVRLEPAGSHGVWGLDDYCFLPFLWGSSQLCGAADDAPRPAAIVECVFDARVFFVCLLSGHPHHHSAHAVPLSLPPLSHSDTTLAAYAPAYLYLDAVRFVRAVKKGPLQETSPMLCDIAATVPTWGRINAGMARMWQAECLGKVPIMQHFLFCGALPFGGGLEEAAEEEEGE